MEKQPAYMYSGREVCLVNILFALVVNGCMGRNQLTEVVHNTSGENLLGNVLRLFAYRLLQANGILQFSERGFNSPAQVVKVL